MFLHPYIEMDITKTWPQNSDCVGRTEKALSREESYKPNSNLNVFG